MASVTDPAHDAGADGVEPDPAGGEFALHPAHPATEPGDVLPGQELRFHPRFGSLVLRPASGVKKSF